MAWKITYGGHTLTQDAITAGHIVAVTALVGRDSWDCVDPASSPQVLAAWCAVVVAAGSGESVEACALFVYSRPLGEILAAVTESVDDVASDAPAATQHPLVDAMMGD
jgi:hypothetical protein